MTRPTVVGRVPRAAAVDLAAAALVEVAVSVEAAVSEVVEAVSAAVRAAAEVAASVVAVRGAAIDRVSLWSGSA